MSGPEVEWECEKRNCRGPYSRIMKNTVICGYRASEQEKELMKDVHRRKYCVDKSEEATDRQAITKTCTECGRRGKMNAKVKIENVIKRFCTVECMLQATEVKDKLDKQNVCTQKYAATMGGGYEPITKSTAVVTKSPEKKDGEDPIPAVSPTLMLAIEDADTMSVDTIGAPWCKGCSRKMTKGQFHDKHGEDWQCIWCEEQKTGRRQGQMSLMQIHDIQSAENELWSTNDMLDDALNAGNQWEAGKLYQAVLRDETMLMVARGMEDEIEALNKAIESRDGYEAEKERCIQKEAERWADQTMMTVVYWGPEVLGHERRMRKIEKQKKRKNERRKCTKCGGAMFMMPIELDGDLTLDEIEEEWMCNKCDTEPDSKRPTTTWRALRTTDDNVERNGLLRLREEETKSNEREWAIKQDQMNVSEDEHIQALAKEANDLEEYQEEDCWLAELSSFVGKPLQSDDDIRQAMKDRERWWAELERDTYNLISDEETEEETRAKDQLKKMVWDERTEELQRRLKMGTYDDHMINEIQDGRRTMEGHLTMTDEQREALRARAEQYDRELEALRARAEQYGREHALTAGTRCRCRFCLKFREVQRVQVDLQ